MDPFRSPNSNADNAYNPFGQYQGDAGGFNPQHGESSNPQFGYTPSNPQFDYTPSNPQFGHTPSNPYFGYTPFNPQFGYTPFTTQQFSGNNEFGESSNPRYEASSSVYNQTGQSASNPFTFDQHNSNEDEDKDEAEEDEEESEENLVEWQTVCTTAAAYTMVYYYEKFMNKEPCRTSIRTGSILINEILQGNEHRCYQNFRMNKVIFIHLCKMLVEKYGLIPTRGMSEYEEVGMFLMTVAHGTGNRVIQEMFNHSGETISRHFHSVLKAICRMSRDYITPATNFNDGSTFHKPQDNKYYPHFKDAIGAIDGTHIKCRVPESERTVYFGRKGYATQNVLAICDFNLCFTFAWAGWEGGAHDSRILNEARTKPELNFPHPTGNKYYLVDAGYAHRKGYMAPYKGSSVRYHIQDFRRANGTARQPRNAKERFNHLHSSCRMVIERTFGVWKARFAILANMPMYKINTQTDIVLATMAIHNYIRKSNTRDNAFQTAEQETYIPENATSAPTTSHGESNREGTQDRVWSAKRDEIAANIA